MEIRFALTKLSILAHKLNVEASNIAFETGCPDDEISRHLEAAETINNLTEAVMGYMQHDGELLQKQNTRLCAAVAEHNGDLREATESASRYKKRIKLLTNKLKRVSETQTSK